MQMMLMFPATCPAREFVNGRVGPLTGTAMIENNEASAKLTTANGGTFT